MADTGGIRAGRAYVEVGADDSKLRAGLRASAAKLKAWGTSIATVGAEIMAVGGLAGAALMETVNSFRASANELLTATAITGVGVERLGALGYAAVQLGGTMEDVTMSMTRMSHFMLKVAQGSDETDQVLQRLHLTAQDLVGLNPDQAMARLGEALHRMGPGMAQNALAMQVFGRAGPGFLRFLGAGTDKIRELTDEAQRLGLVMSAEDVQAGAEMNREWNKLEFTFKRLKDVIGAALVPNMIALFEMGQQILGPLIQWVNANRAAVMIADKLAFYVVALGGALVGLGGALRIVGAALGGFYPLVSATRSAIAATISTATFLVSTLSTVAQAVWAAGVALSSMAFSAVSAGFWAIVSASSAAGGALLSVLLPPLYAVGGALLSLVMLPWTVASSIIGAIVSAAVAVGGAIFGFIAPAFVALGGFLLAPISSLGAFIGSLWASVAAMFSSGGATGVLSTLWGIYTGAVTVAAGASSIMSAVLLGLGVTKAGVAAILTVLTTAWGMYTGAIAIGAGASIIMEAVLLGLGFSGVTVAAITSILGIAWDVYTGATTLAGGASAILQIALIAAGASAVFVTSAAGLLGTALSWVGAAAVAAGGLLTTMSIGEIIAAASTWLLNAAVVALESVTGLILIPLGLLIGAIALLAQIAALAAVAVGIAFAAVLTVVAVVVLAVLAVVAAAAAVIWYFWDEIAAGARTAWNWVADVAVGAWARIKSAAGATWEWMKSTAGSVVDWMGATFDSMADGLYGIFGDIGAAFGTLGRDMIYLWGGVSDAIMAGDWAGALNIVWLGIKIGWIHVVNALGATWREWRDAVIDGATGAWLELQILWHAGAFSISNIWRGLMDFMGRALDATMAAASAAWAAFQDWLTGSDTAPAAQAAAATAAGAAATAQAAVAAPFDAEAARREQQAGVEQRRIERDNAVAAGGRDLADAQRALADAIEQAGFDAEDQRLYRESNVGGVPRSENLAAAGGDAHGTFSAREAGAFGQGTTQERTAAGVERAVELLSDLIKAVEQIDSGEGGVVFA